MHHTAHRKAPMIHTIHRPRLILASPPRSPVEQAVDDLLHGLMAAQALFSPDERRMLGQAVQTLRGAALGEREG